MAWVVEVERGNFIVYPVIRACPISFLFVKGNEDSGYEVGDLPPKRPEHAHLFCRFSGWFILATQTQMRAQGQANTRVNYHNANASANARNGKFFISLRLHLRLRLHFTRVNRGNANANARWTTLVPCLCSLSSNQDGVPMRWKTNRECQKISCALRKKLQRIQRKKQEATCMEWCSKRSGARKRYAFAFGAFALTDDGRERDRKQS